MDHNMIIGVLISHYEQDANVVYQVMFFSITIQKIKYECRENAMFCG